MKGRFVGDNIGQIEEIRNFAEIKNIPDFSFYIFRESLWKKLFNVKFWFLDDQMDLYLL